MANLSDTSAQYVQYMHPQGGCETIVVAKPRNQGSISASSRKPRFKSALLPSITATTSQPLPGAGYSVADGIAALIADVAHMPQSLPQVAVLPEAEEEDASEVDIM